MMRPKPGQLLVAMSARSLWDRPYFDGIQQVATVCPGDAVVCLGVINTPNDGEMVFVLSQFGLGFIDMSRCWWAWWVLGDD